VRKGQREAGHAPADRSLAERFQVREGPDAAARSLQPLLQEFGRRRSFEPLAGVGADQTGSLVAGNVTVDQRWVAAGGRVEPGDDALLQLRRSIHACEPSRSPSSSRVTAVTSGT